MSRSLAALALMAALVFQPTGPAAAASAMGFEAASADLVLAGNRGDRWRRHDRGRSWRHNGHRHWRHHRRHSYGYYRPRRVCFTDWQVRWTYWGAQWAPVVVCRYR